MAVRWTEEQQRVIDTRNCSLLVSAAAGSGKTAVLVERILKIITDENHPVDIDRLLVVTFTNAAAAEMRERVRDALEKRAGEDPDNLHLQRQLVLVHGARIMTIHSFCLQVLRSHFQTAGIDPSFRIADEGEVLLLEQDAVQETVEAAYEAMKAAETAPENCAADTGNMLDKGNAADMSDTVKTADTTNTAVSAESYRRFFESFAPGKSDRAIEALILQTYHYALGQPWPKRWLEECRRMYGDGQFHTGMWGGEEHPAWLRFIEEDTSRMLEDIRKQAARALEAAQEPGGPYPYAAALTSDLEKIEHLQNGTDYRSFAQLFRDMGTFARLGTKKDESISPQKKEQVQAMRQGVKDALAALRSRYYCDRIEVLQEEFFKSGDCIRVLTVLAEDFMERLSAKKLDKNVLDFGDLEHLALQVLAQEDGTPKAAAREYAEQFEEVMIDEYQDSNLVQELILASVSGRGKSEQNRFMVGDVKQSIYRFRLARPELFLEKYRAYQTGGSDVCRIDLHKNFRSRVQVLDAVNRIFRQIMTENPGGIVYDKDAALYPGAEFAPKDGADEDDFTHPELLLLEADASQRQREEARLVGTRIREIVGNELIWDKEQGAYRRAQYRDIVILLRTVSGWSETFAEVLTDMGIPCFTGSQKGYFSAAEIRVVLSYLQILDNPIQDIPLAAVLHSAIGGFDEEELAKIRIAGRKKSFYDCCREYQVNGPEEALRLRLCRFFSVYEGFRAKCAHTPVHLLLWELLEVTGYGEYASSLPGGAQRKANLDMLVEKAMAYEATSYRGLYHFVRYIENLKKYEVDYGEANTGSESADTVRIMSIHKSKGLEFPIVFVSGLGKQFNESDLRARLVLHPDFGIGCDYVDTHLRTRKPTLLKRVIRQKTAAENLGEELRVLYVAMTRAKEKLILTGSVTDAEHQVVAWYADACCEGETLTYSSLASASTYLDWVMPALLRLPDAAEFLEIFDRRPLSRAEAASAGSAFSIRFVTTVDTGEKEQAVRRGEDERLRRLLRLNPDVCCDEEANRYLTRVFAQSYPYEADREIAGKISVSELKRLSQIEEEEAGTFYGSGDLFESGDFSGSGNLFEPGNLSEPGDSSVREEVVPLIPAFRSGKDAPSGAARGTAYHTFMENLSFSEKDALEMQLEELVSCGKMTGEEAGVLRLSDISRFLASRIGARMEAAAREGKLYRERPFVIGVSADTIRPEWNPQETVLVQGIMDAYFEENGELVLLDYKTDRVRSGEELVRKYRAQLDYYEEALCRLTGKKVREKVIYSFWLGKEIKL